MASSSGSRLWVIVFVFLCAVVAIDVFHIHKKGFQKISELSEIGFTPPAIRGNAQPAAAVVRKEVPEKQAEDTPKQVEPIKEEEKVEEKVGVEQVKGAEKVEDAKDGETKAVSGQDASQQHKVAGLSCAKYGGPSDEFAAEMVYWKDIPEDSPFVSPYKTEEKRYLTFEPDEGGWNNIRMSMETAVTMAHAMGRTLVMPPEQGMYLLHKGDKNQKNRFTFTDFFHFESVAAEHSGVDIISLEEFINREIMTGNIVNKTSGQPLFPPDNRTNWNGAERHEAKKLNPWSRSIGFTSPWNFDRCMAAFPAKPNDPSGEARLTAMAQNVTAIPENNRMYRMFINNPVPVNAPPLERLKENLAHRKGLCIYDQDLQKVRVFHLMGDNHSDARLLVHFYAFLFFEDWKQDLWTKRFVRDHLRYIDEIQCAAARVVQAMREKSKENGNGGVFDTLHIRRGDFQYQDTRVGIDVIYNNTFDVLEANSTIYIATDERNKTFFEPLRSRYKIYFMDDFQHELENLNTNYYGMTDQLIASRGRTFIGTFYSTFTGYINRVRGYHSQKDKADGFEKGIINSFYDIPLGRKHIMREYKPISPAMWAREFPVGWRDIDKGIGEVSSKS